MPRRSVPAAAAAAAAAAPDPPRPAAVRTVVRSFVLRLAVDRVSGEVHYELVPLDGGGVYRFASAAALATFIERASA